MARYLEEQNRTEKMRQQKADLPFAISGEEYTKPAKPRYFCSLCQFNLTRISETEYFCNHCKTSAYPSNEEMRSKSRLSVPTGRNTDALISYSPEPDDLSKKSVEIKGALKTLKDRGIKITSYKEGFG